MDLHQAFAALRNAFPKLAAWQGPHFSFADRSGVTLIEIPRHGRYFYWLLWEGDFKIIHASVKKKFGRMRTVGDSFSLSGNYDPATSHEASQSPLRP